MLQLSRLAPLLLASTLTACGTSPPMQKEQPLPVDEVRSLAQRLPPDASIEAVRELTRHNEAFALELLRKNPDSGNLFYSPHSISIALAMAYAGAAGETKAQMKEVLHFEQPDDVLNSAFNTLDQALESRGKGAKGVDGAPFRLRMANAFWTQRGETFLSSYLDILAEDYGSGINLVDFIEHAEKARETINSWVSERTEERIPELLEEGVIGQDTRFVLTNAVYFNAAWAKPFSASATEDGPFTRDDGAEVSVPLMYESVKGRYAEGSDYQAAEIAYDGNEVRLLAILPKTQPLEAFVNELDIEKMNEIVDSLSTARIRLTLPRFELRTKLMLADQLKAMGMRDAFSDAADFSAMNGRRDLYLRHVIHEAFVKVNEEGTEAAAATAVVGERMSADLEEKLAEFKADRPFLFVIRDVETGAALFIGRVTDPS